MSVEKHAEALVKDMLYRTFPADGPDANDIAETHIENAIDEATAPLKARIDELETLNQGYRFRCHSAERDAASSNRAIEQWKDSYAIIRERLEKANARIAQLEGLGLLIEDAMALAFQQGAGVVGKSCSDVKKQIDAILKGES